MAIEWHMNSKCCTNTHTHTQTSMLATTYCYVKIFTLYQHTVTYLTNTQTHTHSHRDTLELTVTMRACESKFGFKFHFVLPYKFSCVSSSPPAASVWHFSLSRCALPFCDNCTQLSRTCAKLLSFVELLLRKYIRERENRSMSQIGLLLIYRHSCY